MKISETTAEFIAKVITGDSNLNFYLCENGNMLHQLFSECGVNEAFYGTKWKWAKDMLIKYNSTNIIKSIINRLLNPEVYIDKNVKRSEVIERLNEYLYYNDYKIEYSDRTFNINKINIQNGEKVANVIFGSTGIKPDIVIDDITSNQIRIISNNGDYIIYNNDNNSSELRWIDLIGWWQEKYNVSGIEAKKQLFKKLYNCCDDGPEKLFWTTYYEWCCHKSKEQSIALLPQVYYHYDPKDIIERSYQDRFYVQRVDFMMLLPNNIRVIFEIDGVHHYSKNINEVNVANPELYSKLVEHDRMLQLQGYRVLRYGGYEFINKLEVKDKIIKDIERVLSLYEVN